MYHFRLQRTDGSPADPPTFPTLRAVSNPCPNVGKPARGETGGEGRETRGCPCKGDTSRHSTANRPYRLEESGGLEVPSSNLGAPIRISGIPGPNRAQTVQLRRGCSIRRARQERHRRLHL
jgi:hypothetical protein